MKKNIKNIIVLLIFLATNYYLLVSNNAVYAQNLPLIVAPARQQLEVAPGEKTAVNIKYYNSSDLPISGIIRVADFLVEDKDGSPIIIDNPLQSSPKYSASTWFTLPFDRMTIPATDKVTIQATIDVPFNAKPGGRYIAIYFEPGTGIPTTLGSDSQEAGTAVGSRIVGLVYLKIAGPITDRAIVSRFFSPSFFEYGPINVTTEILNRGDYHIKPRGVISLVNGLSGLVDQQKLKEENIFPDASRTFTNQVGKKWMIGRYKLSFFASYGDSGQVLEKFIYVWVFPWKVALLVILAIFLASYGISFLYNSFIVKETHLEKELEKEKAEIEKLKNQLRKRSD